MLVYFSLLEVLNAVALFFHAVVFYHDIVRAPKKTQQLLGPQTAVGGLARLASHKAFYLGTSLLSQLLRLAGIGFNLAYSAGAGKIRRDTFVPLGAHPIVEALYATTIYLCTASIGIIWINTAVSAGLWRSARYDLTVNNQLAWLTGTAVVLFLVLFIGVYKMLFWMAGREGVSAWWGQLTADSERAAPSPLVASPPRGSIGAVHLLMCFVLHAVLCLQGCGR